MKRIKRTTCRAEAIALLGAIFCAVPALAQDTQEPAEEPAQAVVVFSGVSGEGGVVQIESANVMAAPMALSPALGQNMAFSLSRPGGAGAWANSINWLNDQNLLDELEIIDEQREQLQSFRDEITTKRSDYFKSFRSVEQSKRGEFMREFGELLSADIDKRVGEILMPHQKKRLEQVQLQTRMRSMGISALSRGTLIKELGITDDQLEELRKKQQEVQEELRKKIEELQKNAQKEVISVLTDSQQKKIHEMIGEEYEFKPRKIVPPITTKAASEKK